MAKKKFINLESEKISQSLNKLRLLIDGNEEASIDIQNITLQKVKVIEGLISQLIKDILPLYASGDVTPYHNAQKTLFGMEQNLDGFSLVQIYINNFLESGKPPIKIFQRLLSSPGYKPPEGPFDIINHLSVLDVYYRYLLPNAPLGITIKIDLTLTQLVYQAVLMLSVLNKKGFNIDRTTKGKVRKKEGKAERKQLVLETYYRIDTDDMTLHKLAKTIKKTLEKEGNQSPSVDTIKRYLKEEGHFVDKQT
ncbi:hypothetical protein ACFL0H_00035 [Thermodesulfobacteriota bacterium]